MNLKEYRASRNALAEPERPAAEAPAPAPELTEVEEARPPLAERIAAKAAERAVSPLKWTSVPTATSGLPRPDAILGFGKHKGSKVSTLASTTEGQGYLRWMLRPPAPDSPVFHPDLLSIVKGWL